MSSRDDLSARTNCEKHFPLVYVDSNGDDCFSSLTFSTYGCDCLSVSGKFHTKESRGRKKDSSGHWINFRQSFNNQTGKQMILLSLDKMALHINVTQRYTYS